MVNYLGNVLQFYQTCSFLNCKLITNLHSFQKMNPFYTHSKEERGEVRSEKREPRTKTRDARCDDVMM